MDGHVAVDAMNPDAAAVRLGLSRSTTYRLIKEGHLRSLKVGRRRLIPTDEIGRFLRDQMQAN